jgi:hypothetical protein
MKGGEEKNKYDDIKEMEDFRAVEESTQRGPEFIFIRAPKQRGLL